MADIPKTCPNTSSGRCQAAAQLSLQRGIIDILRRDQSAMMPEIAALRQDIRTQATRIAELEAMLASKTAGRDT